jgi:hypothetical protein
MLRAQGADHREAFVNNLIMQLGLVKAADTVIGDDKVLHAHTTGIHACLNICIYCCHQHDRGVVAVASTAQTISDEYCTST